MNINYLASHFLASLSCGGSSKENNTYLTMTTTTNPDNLHCLYQICPLNVDICRIKLDFIVSACFFFITATVLHLILITAIILLKGKIEKLEHP